MSSREQIDQPGTYWYHSHNMGQYPDGLRGPLLVHDPQAPYAGTIDEEKVITVSDWYHQQMPELIEYFLSTANENVNGGAEPVPDAALLNDAQDAVIPVQPERTYLFRIINVGAFASSYVGFDGHDMSIVEIDGVYTEPKTTSQIVIAAAQRYSVIVRTKPGCQQNFALYSSMMEDMFDTVPATLQNNVTATIQYAPSNPKPTMPVLASYNPIDDMTLLPYDRMPILDHVDNQIVIHADFANITGINRGIINDKTYLAPKVPTLYTVLSAPDKLVDNPTIYGYINPFILHYQDTIEIVLNNFDNGGHPFHLHGHNFQVIGRGAAGDGVYKPSKISPKPATPMRRDTIIVNEGSWVVLRFKADNPGVALFHCHIEWHVESGLSSTMIEAPRALRRSGLQPPADHLNACKKMGIKTSGNAAGNDQNWLDLTGLSSLPPTNNMGALYTPSGH